MLERRVSADRDTLRAVTTDCGPSTRRRSRPIDQRRLKLSRGSQRQREDDVAHVTVRADMIDERPSVELGGWREAGESFHADADCVNGSSSQPSRTRAA